MFQNRGNQMISKKIKVALIFGLVLISSVGFVVAANSQSGPILDENNNFVMTVHANLSTGYYWVSNGGESHGAHVIDKQFVQDYNDGMLGVGGTYYFTIHVDDINDYYFKINEVSPSGEFTGKSIDSDMVN